MKKTIPSNLSELRYATELDFRTAQNTLKIYVEYYEWMLGVHTWELQITSEETDRDWLKTKIKNQFILISETPILWNQNKEKLLKMEALLTTELC